MISVIIPTYNRSENLERAVESILACNGQYEIIIVDDNGIGTECQMANEKVLGRFFSLSNFSYLKHEKNMNGATARNTGLAIAKGEYVTFLDDDDEFLPQRIESIEKLINSCKPDFIFSNIVVKNNGLLELITDYAVTDKKELQKELLRCESFFGTGSNLVCKKTLVDKINGFDTSYVRHQDFEFMLRYLDVCEKLEFIAKPLVVKNNDDRQNNPNIEKQEIVKKKYLSDFSYIAERYSDEERCGFKQKMYEDLLFQSVIDRKDKLANKYREQLLSIGAYSKTKMIKRVIRYRLRCMKLIMLIRNFVCESKYK